MTRVTEYVLMAAILASTVVAAEFVMQALRVFYVALSTQFIN